MNILEVEGLRKTFTAGLIPRRTEVLKGVSFNLTPGTVTGFLGGNGAGKTTTMKCILDLIFPDSGRVTWFGEQRLSQALKARIGFLPERPYFYDYLTGREFLTFYGELSARLTKAEIRSRIEELLKRLDLTHAGDRRLRDYSKGMLQKVGMAQAVIHRPEMLILDEPMSGLDPDGRFYIADLIQELAQSGTTIFFSSHLLHDVERLCRQIIILKDGVVTYQGSTQQLISKMNPQFELEWIDAQEQVHRVKKESLSSLQEEIDRLRRERARIVRVQEDKMSLEDVFIQVGLKGRDRD
jgi:ABC-2 type transport system ATP-binding protein